MESKKNTKKRTISIRKIAMAGVLVAVAVAGSLISFPVAGSKCAPVQHMVNIYHHKHIGIKRIAG